MIGTALRRKGRTLLPVDDPRSEAESASDPDVLFTFDGVRVEAEMRVSDAALLAHLQMQLVQARFLGRGGLLLVASDPEVTQFLAWVWDESADQLHGRRPRPYRVR